MTDGKDDKPADPMDDWASALAEQTSAEDLAAAAAPAPAVAAATAAATPAASKVSDMARWTAQRPASEARGSPNVS